MAEKGLAIRFDDGPGHTTGRFVEVELDGKSCDGVKLGDWKKDGDGPDWLFVINPVHAKGPEMLEALRKIKKYAEPLPGHPMSGKLSLIEEIALKAIHEAEGE